MTRNPPLTSERILAAAEEVLRRYGPTKATVVDVAHALGVSHGSVYRHFTSKAALRDAILKRWLERVSGPLADIAEADEIPPVRLRRWLQAMRESKRSKANDDPELFATYAQLAIDARTVIGEHVAELLGQLRRIVADGVAAGEFTDVDPDAAALGLFDATARFHHPAMAYLWGRPGEDAAFATLLDILLRGLAH